jgi:hypothetical protein
MISIFISFVIGTMHNFFEMQCKEVAQSTYYNFCIINYYVTCIFVLFIFPYIISKIFYNTENENNYKALFYLFVFTTLAYLL